MDISYSLNKILLENLIAKNSVNKTFEDIAKNLGINIFVLDLNGQTVAYYAQKPLTDYFPDAYKVKNDYICFDYNNGKVFFGLGKSFFDEEKPVCTTPTCENLGYTVFYPIKTEGHPSWVLVLKVEEKTSLENAAKAAPVIAAFCCGRLKESSSVSITKKDILYTVTARELLLYDKNTVTSLSGDSINMRCKALSEKNPKAKPFAPPFAIVIFKPYYKENKDTDYSYCLYDYEYRFPNSFLQIHDGKLYSFIYSCDDSLSQNLESFAYQQQLSAGISDYFDDISERHSFKQQAEDILEIGCFIRSDKYLHKYLDCYEYLLLHSAAKRFSSSFLILSDIEMLDKFDKENNTLYLETLEEYLKNNNSYIAAANALFINRGTLKYRLEKISSLIKLDFENPEFSKILYASIMLYRLKQKQNSGEL